MSACENTQGQKRGLSNTIRMINMINKLTSVESLSGACGRDRCSDDLEAAHDRHLEVEKNEFRTKLMYLLQRLADVSRFTNYGMIGNVSSSPRTTPHANWLVVNDQRAHGEEFHLHQLYSERALTLKNVHDWIVCGNGRAISCAERPKESP